MVIPSYIFLCSLNLKNLINECNLAKTEGPKLHSFINLWSYLISLNVVLFNISSYVQGWTSRVAYNLDRVYILHVSPSIFYHPPYYIHSLIMDEMN